MYKKKSPRFSLTVNYCYVKAIKKKIVKMKIINHNKNVPFSCNIMLK